MIRFSKVAGYKINKWKLFVFLYTSSEQSEEEIKKAVLFTAAYKRIKYLGINWGEKFVCQNLQNITEKS